MIKDFTKSSLEDERRYYQRIARAQAGITYHKKMSDFYGSWRGTVNKLPGAMKDTVKKVARKLLKKSK